MPCAEPQGLKTRLVLASGLLICVWLGSCSSRVPLTQASKPVATAATKSAAAPSSQPVATATARTLEEYRFNAAKRLVAANPGMTYMSTPPEPLLAIPVLEISVRADGSVDRIDVVRVPSQATDTVELAKEAVRRAAPFGDASRLPKPWKFRETFLFDDNRRFKPVTLD